MSTTGRYHPGGYIQGPPTSVILHPDECVLRPGEDGNQSWRCVRSGHSHLRVPREIVQQGSHWTVTHSTFSTVDKTLADDVRAELDAVDPVQGPLCRHQGDLISERTLGDPREFLLCQDCGATLVVDSATGSLRVVSA